MSSPKVPDTETSEWREGMTLGHKYRLLRALGQGGMGTVFEAENCWTGRHVALKVLRPECSKDPLVVQRFVQEAHAASAIRHPNIVDVLDLGQETSDGSLFLVLEHLEGPSLRQRLERGGKLSIREAVDCLVPVMGALKAAHALGIVHRDLKPENIVLTENHAGELTPKLIDFGVSRVRQTLGPARIPTGAGAMLGTPQYMAPEQARGTADVDQRVDLWALGVLWYECLTGSNPFFHKFPGEVLHRVLEGRFPPLESALPGLPPELTAAVHRALRLSREERYPDVNTMLGDLLQFLRRTPELVSAARRHSPSLEHRVSGTLKATRPEAPPERLKSTMLALPRSALALAAASAPATDSEDPESATARLRSPSLAAVEEEVGKCNFEWALVLVDQLLTLTRPKSEDRGYALYLRGTSLRWLGRVLEAHRALLDAEVLLRGRTKRWCEVVAQLAWSCNDVGDQDAFAALGAQLEHHASSAPEEHGALIFASCSLGTAMLHARVGPEAKALLGSMQRLLREELLSVDRVAAAVLSSRAALALGNGDLSAYVELESAAARGFEAGGELREALAARVRAADVWRQAGDYERALQELERVEPEARSLGLVLAVRQARCVAAACLSRQSGRSESAETSLLAVVSEAQKNGDRRAEVTARVHLAGLLLLAEERGSEVAALCAEWPAGESLPEERGIVEALLALATLQGPRPEESLESAQRAFTELAAESMPGESEATVRLAYAQALLAAGEEHRAWGVLAEARKRLAARAKRISNPGLRQTFLHDVAENAATLRLAARHLDVSL